MYTGIWVLIALVVGALLPIQAASNAATSRYFGDASYATLLSFIVGTVVVGLYIAAKKPAPNEGLLAHRLPPYILLGGVISAIYTSVITFLAPRLGVGNTLFTIIIGQAISRSLRIVRCGKARTKHQSGIWRVAYADRGVSYKKVNITIPPIFGFATLQRHISAHLFFPHLNYT